MTTKWQAGRIIIVAGIALCACAGAARAEMGPPIPAHKKLLGYAGHVVEPSYLKQYVAEIEKAVEATGALRIRLAGNFQYQPGATP